jgi:hypothetical protein
MRAIIFLFSVLFLSSCERYNQPSAGNLQGEYVIDIITFQKIDNNVTSDDTTYYPGSTYINPDEIYPMDTIKLGFTTWRFDYNIISMAPVLDGFGRKIWTKQYLIDMTSSSGWEDGYIEFMCEGTKRVFRVIDRQPESMTLRSSGQWPFANLGAKQEITLQLSRTGP